MSPGQLVALAVIIGGGYWMITGQNPLSLLGLSDETVNKVNDAIANVDAKINESAQVLAQRIGIDTQTAPLRGGKGAYTFAGAGASTAAGIATGAGLAASTALLATGIGAAGALLVWGITQKGWFRGGEEGIRVNPARNEFLNVWVRTYYPEVTTVGNDKLLVGNVTDPVTGYSGDAQYAAMVRAFHDAGVNGNLADQTITQLYAADSMEEFKVAAENFLNVLKSGVH